MSARRDDAIAERARWTAVDDMSDDSFPASDPPAVWTWDVGRPPFDEPRETPMPASVRERYAEPDDR
jgi:hypothetical protein